MNLSPSALRNAKERKVWLMAKKQSIPKHSEKRRKLQHHVDLDKVDTVVFLKSVTPIIDGHPNLTETGSCGFREEEDMLCDVVLFFSNNKHSKLNDGKTLVNVSNMNAPWICSSAPVETENDCVYTETLN